MAFQYSEFTNTGAQLLSAASATKTIVIDTVYCMSSAISESDLLQSTPAWCAQHPDVLYTVLARVISVGVDPNTDGMSRIVIDLSAEQAQSDVTIRTVIVTAHYVEAGSESATMTFYGVTDPAGVVVPVGGPVPISQQIAFTFAFSRASSITVADSVSNYLLADEVGRFMTTHSTSSTVSGDDQSVYGVKSFKSGLVAETLRGSYGIQFQESGNFTGSIATDTTRTKGLQFVTSRLYDEEGVAVFSFKDDSGSVLAHISYDTSVDGRFTTYAVAVEALRGNTSDTISVEANLVSGLGYTLGSSSEPWTNAYIDELQTFTHKSSWEGTNGAFTMTATGAATGYRIRVERPGGSYMDCTLSPTRLLVGGLLTCTSFSANTSTLASVSITDRLSIGGELDAGALRIAGGSTFARGDILPEVSGSVSLGTSSRPFSSVFGDELLGNTVVATKYSVNGQQIVPQLEPLGGSVVRVGDTVEVSVAKAFLGASGITTPKRFGDTIDVPAGNSLTLGCWVLDDEWNFRGSEDKLPAGRYALKSALEDITTYSQYVIKLLRLS